MRTGSLADFEHPRIDRYKNPPDLPAHFAKKAASYWQLGGFMDGGKKEEGARSPIYYCKCRVARKGHLHAGPFPTMPI